MGRQLDRCFHHAQQAEQALGGQLLQQARRLRLLTLHEIKGGHGLGPRGERCRVPCMCRSHCCLPGELPCSSVLPATSARAGYSVASARAGMAARRAGAPAAAGASAEVSKVACCALCATLYDPQLTLGLCGGLSGAAGAAEAGRGPLATSCCSAGCSFSTNSQSLSGVLARGSMVSSSVDSRSELKAFGCEPAGLVLAPGR